jgi:uncharacterized membrane protein YphA (DoxX/SURF4 family)
MQAAIMSDVVDKVLSDVEARPKARRPQPEPIPFHANPEPAEWNLATRIGFRFAFLYFVLYNLPFPLDSIPLVATRYEGLWNKFVPWAGAHFLGLNITVLPNGSGDTTFNYVQVLLFLFLAILGTVAWSLLDRARADYEKLDQWLRLYLRVALGAILISYGSMKVIQAQMPPPPLSRLVEAYGDSSPMGLLWTFMGASRGYNAFAGGAEMLAGLLLFVPGLTALGALLAIAVMSNVFMLNMCYDVPVKLFSFHLLLMAVFLAIPDVRRLINLFVLRRKVQLSVAEPLFHRRWLNRGSLVAQFLFGLFVITASLYGAHLSQNYSAVTVGAPLYGVWSVDEFTVDGKVEPPLPSEEQRWQRVIFDYPNRLTVQPMSGFRQRFVLNLEKPKQTFTLSKLDDPHWKADFHFQNTSPGTLALTGHADGHSVIATLRHVDAQKTFLLTSRGFHWINEYPFNR